MQKTEMASSRKSLRLAVWCVAAHFTFFAHYFLEYVVLDFLFRHSSAGLNDPRQRQFVGVRDLTLLTATKLWIYCSEEVGPKTSVMPICLVGRHRRQHKRFANNFPIWRGERKFDEKERWNWDDRSVLSRMFNWSNGHMRQFGDDDLVRY
jgi:hypothetical protein